MKPALLDTDIFSEILKGRDANVISNARRYQSQFSSFTVSVVTVAELVKGFARLDREDRIVELRRKLARQEVLIFDQSAAEIAGRILAALEAQGKPIGRMDPLVAAIALRHGLDLVTGNENHYARVVAAGFPLVIENWRKL